jgi:hypothetical protein
MEVNSAEKKVSLNQQINDIISNDQGRTYVTAIATIALVTLMIIFAIIPSYTSIQEKMALNEEKKVYLAALDQKQSNIFSLVEQRDILDPQVKLMNIYFKDQLNTELMVSNISKLSEERKCRFNNLSFNKVAKSKNVMEINPSVYALGFTVSVNCKISEIQAFFDSINNFPIPLYITNVSYSNKKDANSSGSILYYDRFNFAVTGEMFYWNTTPPTIN